MWKLGKSLGDREGRMDVCVAAAGILKPDAPSLTYPAKVFQEVSIGLDWIAVSIVRQSVNRPGFCRSTPSTSMGFCSQRRPRGSKWSVSGTAGASSCWAVSAAAGRTKFVSESTSPHRARKVEDADIATLGPRMGIVQHVQVCRAPDGPEHGLRTRSEEDQSQHDQPRIHSHSVWTH